MMKHMRLMGIFAVGLLLFVPGVIHAERINSYDVNILVNQDASIQVQETIEYNFESESKHGIFRDIPLKNSDGSILEVGEVSVHDENNIPHRVSSSRDNASIRIKIGDPDRLVSGIKTYRISYRVTNALASFDTYDELYWNAIGNGWDVPIESTRVSVILPDSIPGLQVACYRGKARSSDLCDGFFDPQHLSVQETGLTPGEGVTVAVGFPQGIVAGITRIGGADYKEDQSSSLLVKILVILISLASLVGTFAYWRKMRDPKSKNPVVAWYEPPAGLSPILMGSLIDKQTDMRDVTSHILYLATRGYLTIERIETKRLGVFEKVDYLFTLSKNPSNLSFAGDRSVIEMLFASIDTAPGTQVLLSQVSKDSKMRVQKKIAELRESSKAYLTSSGYYETQKRTPASVGLAFLFIMIVSVVSRLHLSRYHPLIDILIPVGIVCSLVMALIKQKYTTLGIDTRQQILGFKDFLSVTDKHRLDFHNAPEKNPAQFMEFLPYAVALGVEKKWAKQFEGMMIPDPTWYRSSGTGAFIAADVASQMLSFKTAFAGASASSGSRGGGFSGGGSGGGGGGSW